MRNDLINNTRNAKTKKMIINGIIGLLNMILAYKSRNFGPNFNLLFDIQLIRGSTKIQILKIRVRWAGGFTR
jgi:hypothetical protein